MIAVILVACSLSLSHERRVIQYVSLLNAVDGFNSFVIVSCQERPTTAPTRPPTRHPPIHHNFSVDNAVFLRDLAHHVMVLKTDSGCYVTHLTPEQIKHMEDAEGLLRIEAEIIHHVRMSHHFAEAQHTNVYKDAIQKACPKIYAYHHEHH